MKSADIFYSAVINIYQTNAVISVIKNTVLPRTFYSKGSGSSTIKSTGFLQYNCQSVTVKSAGFYSFLVGYLSYNYEILQFGLVIYGKIYGILQFWQVTYSKIYGIFNISVATSFTVDFTILAGHLP